MTTPDIEREIYSVSRLNREAKLLLEKQFRSVFVEGEISNLATPSSGHIYFSLKDENAQARCAMFRSRLRYSKAEIQNGAKIVVRANASLYEQRGDYQLIVETTEPAGDGDLRLQFEKLLRELTKEGLFESQHKKSLPLFPETVGLITSPSGAAIHDILTVFKRRAPQIRLIIYPTAVQGMDAEPGVIHALKLLDQRKECDLAILARGGGSAEDLSLFNSELIARAIFKTETPIITGIGHETDFTIADFVADHRAATPSVAAETACPDQKKVIEQINQKETTCIKQIKQKLEERRKALAWATSRLQQQHPGRKLEQKAQRIDELELRSRRSVEQLLRTKNSLLDIRSNQLQRHNPQHKLSALKIRNGHLYQRLSASITKITSGKNQLLRETVRTLEAVSPLSTLARGYAIVSDSENNDIIRSASEAHLGQLVTTKLSEGNLLCSVKEINHEN